MRQSSIERQLRGNKKRGRRNVKRSSTCGNKKRYRDHGEAIGVLRAARDTEQNRTIPTRAYECHVCGGWHLTSQADRG